MEQYQYKYGSINPRLNRERSRPVREDSRGNLFDKNGNLVEMKDMSCCEIIYFRLRRLIMQLFY
jgi:hypothetical protein